MAFRGDLSGITSRNKPNATYQSMIDGELMYEYAIYRFNKNKTKASFRCAGCRSAKDDGRAPEFRLYYLKGAVDFDNKTVVFDEDPDAHPHCCERRHPHFIKGKQIKRHVRNEIKGSGIVGSQCLTKLNQKVKECEENGDHDGVMCRIGTTETVRRRLKAAAKPTFVQNCMPTDIDEELQKSSFSNGSNIVRINDEDFVFLMEDKGIEILRKAKYWKFDGTFEKRPPGFDGPRTTNSNECFHSSLNTVIPEKKMSFRLCFTRFKQTLADAANDYMRSNYGEILKPREKQYVEAERLIIRRKRRMRALYDAGNHPGIDSLLRYSAVQAWRSTQPFEETVQDPRFVLQNVEPAPAPQPPPVIPEPIIAPIPPVVQPFVRIPFHQQQFNQNFNPYFQHQNNIQHIPQQFNMSLPIYYQQPPPQQFYVQQFPPYFYNPRF